MTTNLPTVADLLAGKGDKLFVIKESATLAEAATILARHRIGILLVIGEPEGFRGVISERDVVKAVAARGADAAALKVGEVATHTVRACDASRTLVSVLESMEQGHFRHMPVVDGGKIRGVVSITDILKYIAKNQAASLAAA